MYFFFYSQGTRGRRSIDFAKNVAADGVNDNYSIHNQKNDNEALNHGDEDNHVGDPSLVFSPSAESITDTSLRYVHTFFF